MKQQFLKDKTGTIRVTVYDNNRALIPSAATITLYKQDGTNVLQAEASATIDSTTGEMTYSLTTAHTATLGVNFKAVWKYTVSAVDYYETQLYDVVRSILSIPLTDDDLYAELPSLRKSNVQATGTATAGASGSLTDTARRKEADNYWKGGQILIESGIGAGQTRDITGSTQSTGVLTVSPNFTTTPDTTSVYRVVKSWSIAIQNAFDKFEQMLYDKGKRDALILEASQIKVPLLYLTLTAVCMDLRDKVDDKWDMLKKDYEAKFEKAFTTMALDYDEDESGGVQGQEVQQNVSSFRIQRS